MGQSFASGTIIDLILALIVLEAIVLSAHRRMTGRGLPALDVLNNLLPGICLLLALRGALTAAWWGWIAVCLFGALVAHLIDLRRRWHN